MIERLVVLLAIAAAIALVWSGVRLWRWFTLRRLRAATPFAAIVPRGQPAVVAFSTPTCAECRTRQTPALNRLRSTLGDRVTITTLSALDHPDLAAQLGVLTVPTTVIVDRRGVVRTINAGYTDEARLATQLEAL